MAVALYQAQLTAAALALQAPGNVAHATVAVAVPEDMTIVMHFSQSLGVGDAGKCDTDAEKWAYERMALQHYARAAYDAERRVFELWNAAAAAALAAVQQMREQQMRAVIGVPPPILALAPDWCPAPTDICGHVVPVVPVAPGPAGEHYRGLAAGPVGTPADGRQLRAAARLLMISGAVFLLMLLALTLTVALSVI